MGERQHCDTSFYIIFMSSGCGNNDWMLGAKYVQKLWVKLGYWDDSLCPRGKYILSVLGSAYTT